MGQFSLTHILILAIILLIFFGPSRLPQLGQSLGKAIRGFKQGLNEIDAESKDISHTNQSQQQNQQLQNSQTNIENQQSNVNSDKKDKV